MIRVLVFHSKEFYKVLRGEMRLPLCEKRRVRAGGCYVCLFDRVVITTIIIQRGEAMNE